MNLKKLVWTKRFSKDVKRAKKRNWELDSLQNVVQMLQSNSALPREYKPHPLKGSYSGYMECHLETDWLLIWKDDRDAVYLTRTGTHSDLFG